jgi:cytochrome d ubiquinol oxidase subunit I
MDPILLARLQFAITLCFHFIFPSVTIGLSLMLCVVEWLGWRRDDGDYVRMSQLFGRLFGITFAVGIATGVVMLFQFGTNWGNYARFVANVFGAALASEGFFAFFLESTFVGVYLFGRGRVSKGIHWFSSLMVALGASTLSSFFIIAANSWQQTPAGYVLRNGHAELTSLYQAIFNPSTMLRYGHVITGTLIAGAFIFSSVGAWHVLNDRHSPVGRKALRFGVWVGLLFACLQLYPFGHESAELVAHYQPEKSAVLEGHYKSESHAPLVVFGIPHIKQGQPELRAKIGIPGMLSYLAYGSIDANVPGLREFPREDWPPLLLPFATYHLMVALGMFFIAVMAIAAYRLKKGRLYDDRWLLRVLVWSVPLPIIAIELGWITAEVGRQPWVVYKLLRTADAASPAVATGAIVFSLALFTIIYLALFGAWLFLMIRKAKKFPAEEKDKEQQEWTSIRLHLH